MQMADREARMLGFCMDRRGPAVGALVGHVTSARKLACSQGTKHIVCVLSQRRQL